MSDHNQKLTNVISHLERITGENVREEYCLSEDDVQTALKMKRDLCIFLDSLYDTYPIGDDLPIFVLASMLSDRLHTSPGVGMQKIADSLLDYEEPQGEFNDLFLEFTHTPIENRAAEYEHLLFNLCNYIFEDLKRKSVHTGGSPVGINICTLDLSKGRVVDDVLIDIEIDESEI